MTIRLAASVVLLGIVSCTPSPPMPEAIPRTEQQTLAGSSAPPLNGAFERLHRPDSATSDAARRRPSLEPWKALFELNYDDPGIIDDFLAEVRSTPDMRRTIILETTLSWGCPCPTWVFPFYEDMQELRHVMVFPSPALNLDPTDFATAERSYRLTGYFSGTAITGLDWVNQRGEVPPTFPKASTANPALREYWAAPGLVFVVESWCFEENALKDDAKWLRKQGATSCND
ncbi:MAG: hypothetical protein KAR13_05385 [Desulfobulbaceae bacterium]|nr:hypothetical protein [Desulfobulbaceae bacterium]